MNFYKGNRVDEVEVRDHNVGFSDELLDFIYKSGERALFNMNKLIEIDPYGDAEIHCEDLPELIEICNYVMSKSLLKDYERQDEGNSMLANLVELAQEAKKEGVGLVSIGD